MYGSQSYTYDGVGNRLTRVAGGVTDTYAYSPAANQVSTITTGSNVRSFSYLASGQVSQDVRDGSHTYTFAANDNGRNASATLNGSTADNYLYNAFEQRVQKVAGGVTTQLVFDRFGHLLAEADASGTAQKEYIWLDDLPVAMMDDTGPAPVRYYIHTDQLGTPQKITDGAANIVWDGQFDPFGNIIPISITPTTGGTNWGTGVWGSFNWALTPVVPQTNNLRFPGQYADAEPGLSQNWNRDYDPTIGRYVQSDPIGLVGGINGYSYASSSPVNRVDVMGLWQLAVSGGADLGTIFTIGKNSGQWNLGLWLGAGEGLAFEINKADSGCQVRGLQTGFNGQANINLGTLGGGSGGFQTSNVSGISFNASKGIGGGVNVGGSIGGTIGPRGTTKGTKSGGFTWGVGDSAVIGWGSQYYF